MTLTGEQATRLERCKARGFECADRWKVDVRTKRKKYQLFCAFILCDLPCPKEELYEEDD